ncbi:MAG: TonB-dependent receptor [Telmatospirillum sp.]|nr:TonB-dependent receptor [Telmatospirillum sp.]
MPERGWAAPAPVTIDEVVITSPSVETTTTAELAKFGSKTEVITRDEIEKAGPSADITRVLEMYVPGLFVAPKSGPFDYGTYSLLGGRAGDILIMMDGVRLNNRLYGGLYIDTIPTVAVERIEVLKGGQSLFFGTEAVSGVINIVTRHAQSDQPSGAVSVGLDSWGGFDGDARVERRIANGAGHLEMLGFASENVSRGYKPFHDKDLRQPNTDPWRSYDVTTVGGKAAQTFDERDARLELFYQVSRAKLDFVYPAYNRDTYNDRLQQIAAATFEQQLTDGFRYFIKSHVNSWDTNYTRKLNGTDGSVIVRNDKNYWGFLDYGVQGQGEVTLPGGHALVMGVDSQWYEGRDEVLTIASNTAEAYGVYAQIRPVLPWLPDWHPAAGVRHETVSGGGQATVWNVSNRYDVTPALSLRGQAGTSFRLPTAEELFANEPDDIGNPKLKPEKSTNYEAGVDVKQTVLSRPVRLSATFYQREISSLISQDSSFRYVNGTGQVETRGIDVDTHLQLNESWHAGADAGRFTQSTENAGRILNIPQSTARARLGYDSPDRRWGAEVSGRYVGTVRTSSGVNYGGYAVFDGNAYVFIDEAKSQKVTVLLENLFNRGYATSQTTNGLARVPILGRPLTAELRYGIQF